MSEDGLNWDKAESRLYYSKQAYEKVPTGLFALAVKIFPLVQRYESGERTEELYNEIMDLEL